jgi:hypothetical protein
MHFSADVLYSYLLSDLEAHVDLTLPGWAPDSTPRQAACLALRDSLLKKFNQGDMPPADACRAALEKFKAVNERCGRWELVLESTYDEFLVNAVKREIENFWYREGVDPLSRNSAGGLPAVGVDRGDREGVGEGKKGFAGLSFGGLRVI